MVSPIMWFDPTQRNRNPPQTAKKAARTPSGMTIVSPTSSTVDTPSTIGQITPTRKMLFERTPGHRSSFIQTTSNSSSSDNKSRRSYSNRGVVDTRQDEDIQDLRSSDQDKDVQLRVLNKRFHTIQQGLGSIDQERNLLVDKAKQLEKEKRNIEKQLVLREQEIQVLVKRCASQEEKMRESSRLRAQNRELSQALESIQNRQGSGNEQERDDLTVLRQMLQESELSREQLQMKLQRLQREHDAIANTLQQCLGNIRKLTEEKQQIETERRNELKRAEIELEEQRLAHAHAMETKQSKIDQMESILKDNMYMKNSLRREKVLRQEEAERMMTDYENRISELHEELERRAESTDAQDQYEEALSLFERKLEVKDALMMGLKNEFAGQMGELMKKQTCLDKVEAEKNLLQYKIEKLEKMECDYSALVDYVDILDSNVADLTNENAHLTIDKESLEEERANLQHKLKELENQIGLQQQHRQAREGDFHDLLEAEREELRTELEASLAEAKKEAVSLQSELASRGRWIEKLEAALSEGRRDVIEKQKQIRELEREKEEISSAVESLLSKARQEVSQLEADVKARDDQLRSLQLTLDTQTLEYTNHKERVKQLENDLCAKDGKQDENYLARLELEARVQELGLLVANLNKLRNHLMEENHAEKSAKIKIEQKKADLEESLRSASLQLRSYEDQIKSLEETNKSLKLEVDEFRETSRKSEANSSKALSRSEELSTEFQAARALLEEKEGLINRLQNELAGTFEEKSSSLNTLEDAQRRIESLESKLANKAQIEIELKYAHDCLDEQKSKTRNIEEEHSAATKAHLEREDYFREASSKIAHLENQILELKDKLKESAMVLDSKDRDLNLVEIEKQQFEKRAIMLNDQLEEKQKILESSEQRLVKQMDLDASLKSELEETTRALSSNEKRINGMDAALTEIEKEKSDLETKLSDSMTMRDGLQHEILTLRAQSTSLDNQLHAALESISNKDELIRETTRKLEEKSLLYCKMETEFEATTQSKAETEDKLFSCESKLASLEEITAASDKSNAALEQHLKRKNSDLATMEAKKKILQNTIDTLEKDLAATNKTSDEQFQDIRLQHTQACLSLAEKETLIDSLEESIHTGKEELERIQRQLLESREEIGSLDQEIIKRDERIKGLQQEVEFFSKNENDIGRAFAESEMTKENLLKDLEQSRATVDTLSKSLKERESRVLELEQGLDDSNQYAKNVQGDLEAQLTQERERHSVTNAKLAGLEVKVVDEGEKFQGRVSKLEEEIDFLRNQLKETVESKENAYRAMQAEMQSQVTKLQTTIILKDDEIQELRVIELKDREETIATLSESLHQLKTRMADNEIELTRVSNDLKRENKNLQGIIGEQEREFLLVLERQEAKYSKKEQQVRDLETARMRVETQLEERKSVVSDLSERELDLQKQERILLASCDQLIQSETSAKEELHRTKNALDLSILKAKEDLDLQRRDLEMKFRKESAEMASKLDKMEKKYHETDSVMRVRSTLLSEVVDHNDDLESKLSNLQAQVSALEGETCRCKQEMSETQNELVRVREELCKRERELTSKLNEERSHRDNAERSVAKLKVQCKDAAHAKKRVAELERDNFSLKDKISRQEAYLERKIRKEKVTQARVTHTDGDRTPVRKGASSSSSSIVVLQTPSRTSRPSFLKTPSSINSSIRSIDDNSQRSNRSVATSGISSSLQRLKSRSVIPSIHTTTSSETI